MDSRSAASSSKNSNSSSDRNRAFKNERYQRSSTSKRYRNRSRSPRSHIHRSVSRTRRRHSDRHKSWTNRNRSPPYDRSPKKQNISRRTPFSFLNKSELESFIDSMCKPKILDSVDEFKDAKLSERNALLDHNYGSNDTDFDDHQSLSAMAHPPSIEIITLDDDSPSNLENQNLSGETLKIDSGLEVQKSELPHTRATLAESSYASQEVDIELSNRLPDEPKVIKDTQAALLSPSRLSKESVDLLEVRDGTIIVCDNISKSSNLRIRKDLFVTGVCPLLDLPERHKSSRINHLESEEEMILESNKDLNCQPASNNNSIIPLNKAIDLFDIEISGKPFTTYNIQKNIVGDCVVECYGNASNSNCLITEGIYHVNHNNNFEVGQSFDCHLSSDSGTSRQGDLLCNDLPETVESSTSDSLMMKEDGNSSEPCLSEDLIDELFKRHSKLKFKVDDKISTYKCAMCPKSYKSDRSLRRHWQDAHTGPQSWICMFCEQNFKSKSMLQTHLSKNKSCHRKRSLYMEENKSKKMKFKAIPLIKEVTIPSTSLNNSDVKDRIRRDKPNLEVLQVCPNRNLGCTELIKKDILHGHKHFCPFVPYVEDEFKITINCNIHLDIEPDKEKCKLVFNGSLHQRGLLFCISKFEEHTKFEVVNTRHAGFEVMQYAYFLTIRTSERLPRNIIPPFRIGFSDDVEVENNLLNGYVKVLIEVYKNNAV